MYAEYDDALRILSGTSPESGGRPNHGAMIAAALIEMGRGDVVMPWIQRYRHQLESRLPVQSAIERHNWQFALGAMGRSADWVVFFQRALAESDWLTVLKQWIPLLAPGLSGAGGNGAIRAVLCLNGLAADPNKVRHIELAEGLAYWASRYHKLPGLPAGPSAGMLLPTRALNRIPRFNKDTPPTVGTIGEGLRGLAGAPEFTGIINLVSLSDDPEVLIGLITDLYARLILAHREEPRRLMALFPALSVSSAMRALLPFLSLGDARLVLRYLWQFTAALYAVFGCNKPASAFEPVPEDIDELVHEAVATGNEYIILMTAACRREYLLHPKPAFPAAIKLATQIFTTGNDETREEPGFQLYRDL